MLAATFESFRRAKVDVAVIEVGMGGRLDGTNVITPKVIVLTNIGLDHMEFLGNTVEKIAARKGRDIQEGRPDMRAGLHSPLSIEVVKKKGR